MLAWLFARSTNRAFQMRIEDIDTARDQGAATQQLADLAALGIDWDGEVVIQSQQRAAHEAALDKLQHAELTYECYCTRREIAEATSAPHQSHPGQAGAQEGGQAVTQPGAYAGTCIKLTEAEREKARAQITPRKPAIRVRVPEHLREIAFEDVVMGRITGHVDDFVLQRGDGAIAYNLAVVVDDAAMGVDQVVRGDDLAMSTPRHIALQRLLGVPTPEYAHVPLVLGPTGARLAKRDGSVTLADLATEGVSAAQVRSTLAHSLALAAQDEPVDMAELLRRFDPAALPKDAWVYAGWRSAV